MKNIQKALLVVKIVATVLVVVWAVRYVSSNTDAFYVVVESLSLLVWVKIVCVYLLIITVQSLTVLVSLNTRLNISFGYFIKAYLTNSLSSLLGFFLPSSAAISKLFFLSRIFQLAKTECAEIVARITHVQIITSVILGFLVFYIYWFINGANSDLSPIAISLTIVVAFFILILLALLVIKKGPLNGTGIFKPIYRFIDNAFPNSKTQLFRILILHSFQQFLFAFVLFTYFSALGFSINILECLFLVCVGGLALFISFTPGNIGVKEGVYFYLAKNLGIDVSILVPILLFDRFFQVLFISISASVFGFLNSRNVRELQA